MENTEQPEEVIDPAKAYSDLRQLCRIVNFYSSLTGFENVVRGSGFHIIEKNPFYVLRGKSGQHFGVGYRLKSQQAGVYRFDAPTEVIAQTKTVTEWIQH